MKSQILDTSALWLLPSHKLIIYLTTEQCWKNQSNHNWQQYHIPTTTQKKTILLYSKIYKLILNFLALRLKETKWMLEQGNMKAGGFNEVSVKVTSFKKTLLISTTHVNRTYIVLISNYTWFHAYNEYIQNPALSTLNIKLKSIICNTDMILLTILYCVTLTDKRTNIQYY
jgi:hypothetical protein